jgi:hypothetical protein
MTAFVTRRKWRLLAFISAMLGFLLLTTGCPLFMHSDSTYTPKATDDGSGGAIVVYQDIKGSQRDFYAQRISPDGKSLWGDRGILIGTAQSESYSFPVFDIVGDGTGGAIIAWPDLSPNQLRSVEYLTKISSEGNVLWRRNFVSFDRLIGDGAGGAIIAFDRAVGIDITSYIETSFVIVKIDSQGNYPWGPQGVTIPRERYWPNTMRIVSDGNGGVIAIWEEMQSQQEPTPPNATNTWRIMAQKIDAEGNTSWGDSGVIVSTNPENTVIEEPSITNDGSGGAILAWHQYPSGKVVGGSPEWLLQDIFAQRIDPSGNILWQQGGVPVGIVQAAELASPHTPLLISNSAGGAVIIWEDLRNVLASIYAQEVTADGTFAWQPGGVEALYVRSNASLAFRQIIGDGRRGTIVSCRFNKAETGEKVILIQKLDSSGKLLWSSNGIVVFNGATTNYSLSFDGQGGAIITWGIGASGESYIQRVSSEGRLLWSNKGIRLSP